MLNIPQESPCKDVQVFRNPSDCTSNRGGVSSFSAALQTVTRNNLQHSVSPIGQASVACKEPFQATASSSDRVHAHTQYTL